MPAGNPEKLKYAFAYGADAVYAGVPIFSLRARENGFTPDSIREAITYSHALGKRLYLTMNSFVHNNKVNAFLNSFCEMQDLNPDGFIMSGVGPIAACLKLRPQAVIHLSTQMNTTNWTDVQFWRDLGVKRIVLSRELSLKEIAEIHHKVPDIELECFVHGAICIAYSGRCLISNYLTHRNANEGTCTNSCRWQYKLSTLRKSLVAAENEQHVHEGSSLEEEYFVTESTRPDQHFPLDEDEQGTYLMNSKDLCAIELLRELRDAGVCSFKVEGRSKGIYYVATIARAYRRAIDDMVANRPFNPQNLDDVVATSNRTLMTGFYLRRPNEYGQNYSDGASRPLTFQFAGQVLAVHPKTSTATVLFKNTVSPGESIEWVSPDGVMCSRVSTIRSEAGELMDRVYGGHRAVIDCPQNTSETSLLRTPLSIHNQGSDAHTC